uniref:pro-MCH n=1 Tax=Pristiophorus japonicus TaxID=55135 RepID=UPI00398EBB72
MTTWVYTALFISALFSVEFSISSAKAVGQWEGGRVPENDFNREMLANVGGQAERPRSPGSFKPYQLLQLDKDLGFKVDPKTIRRPFNSASQRLFKVPLSLAEPMEEQLYFSAKRTDAVQASNQLEAFEKTEEGREANDGENGATLPVGKRDFDILRCMLGRVYRPCW